MGWDTAYYRLGILSFLGFVSMSLEDLCWKLSMHALRDEPQLTSCRFRRESPDQVSLPENVPDVMASKCSQAFREGTDLMESI